MTERKREKWAFWLADTAAFALAWLLLRWITGCDVKPWLLGSVLGAAPMCGWLLLHWALLDWRERRGKAESAPFAYQCDVVPWTGRRVRLLVVGIGPARVLPNEVSSIQVSTNRRFVPRALVVPASVAEKFSIVEIRVGTQSVLSELDAEILAEASEGVVWPPVEPGCDMTVNVFNNSREAETFTAVATGYDEPPQEP